ncbi:hypothetical protein ZOD2009_03365 [Haladaptatus paucihalophilus DX253]|uniref:Uncharacterized protein n=1 Tax=Haladaptatus paucihalophilus DX253 TaxID=797209 RepID=E7QNN3_HALPU|nr:DUF5828 family protein [Haladaptatus paucihalophilus]EFW94150.1 hypothetical protein ZOD2009_03365 [Haladaptatus paucihalophilus DX253]SHK60214.1 hypothetical protein SAMN05444342_1819 [Haladaptatus paucihalophilus DX253]
MEESIAGFKETGDWVAIVEHGERITKALDEEGIEGHDFDEWNEWRPKAGERLREDVNEKTAKQASAARGEGEKAGKSSTEDAETAREELEDTVSELAEGDIDDALKEGKGTIEYATRAADTAGRKALRTVEETVYKHVMTQVSPAYFDNELVSANVERGRGENRYTFEVNVNDDDLKARVSDRLKRYDEEIDRWRGETEKETESVEAAEGIDPVE